MKNNFLQTPSKSGVMLRKTFSHTPDEAKSVGLVKACVFQKIYSVIEKLDPRMTFTPIVIFGQVSCHMDLPLLALTK